MRPLRQSRNLADEVVAQITEQIVEGNLTPGERLPTEQEMMASFGISRTVVREAVAALRGDGLVKTRQGVGAFVAEDAQQRPFRIDPDQLVSLHNVLNIMELRMSVEIEAAGLAAERRTASQLKRISDTLNAIENDLDRNDYAVDNDFKFHCAIAEATGNPYYVKFLEFLGNFIIPRQTVNFISGSEQNQLDYLRGVQKEHRQIDAAIADANAKLARDVMRRHIVSSRRRYEIIAKKLEKRDG